MALLRATNADEAAARRRPIGQFLHIRTAGLMETRGETTSERSFKGDERYPPGGRPG